MKERDLLLEKRVNFVAVNGGFEEARGTGKSIKDREGGECRKAAVSYRKVEERYLWWSPPAIPIVANSHVPIRAPGSSATLYLAVTRPCTSSSR